jgi:threonine/homoserine/homoserine lactone efflux protein
LDQLNIVITIVIAGLLLSSSPGPSMAYVLSRSVQFGHAGGLASSFGLAVGGLIHALLAALGLALLAVKFPVTLQVLKYVGAAYLCYLAYDALRGSFQKTDEKVENIENVEDSVALGANILINNATVATVAKSPLLKLFFNGVLIELSNPKTILFFLSFMPQFIGNNSTLGIFLLSSLIPLTAIPADLLAIFAGAIIAKKASKSTWLVRVVNLAVAAVLFGIAIWIVFSD